jgi:hypothetical protein
MSVSCTIDKLQQEQLVLSKARSWAAPARQAGRFVRAGGSPPRTVYHSTHHTCRGHSPPAKLGRKPCLVSSLRLSGSVISTVGRTKTTCLISLFDPLWFESYLSLHCFYICLLKSPQSILYMCYKNVLATRRVRCWWQGLNTEAKFLDCLRGKSIPGIE